ncbi:MAG TPA: glycine cleavage system protein GcvH [Chromatiales bacterium]|nr:glycine cleavage system protein GcvH [Thiotrichales bacterium]HIP68539.1 glycine cleavage system protein GcvH [Chromatiales bacterium]
MSDIPSELRYTQSHEWVQVNDDDVITVGITDHAQELLGDLVFIELPSVGDEVAAEDACVVVESVKAASDVYAPVAGEVVAVNTELDDAPELVNTDPYGEGWLFKLRVADTSAVESLLDADAYGDEVHE